MDATAVLVRVKWGGAASVHGAETSFGEDWVAGEVRAAGAGIANATSSGFMVFLWGWQWNKPWELAEGAARDTKRGARVDAEGRTLDRAFAVGSLGQGAGIHACPTVWHAAEVWGFLDGLGSIHGHTSVGMGGGECGQYGWSPPCSGTGGTCGRAVGQWQCILWRAVNRLRWQAILMRAAGNWGIRAKQNRAVVVQAWEQWAPIACVGQR